ncbi:hypothetical protein ACI65C_012939 [Semiaphis heraclei]
MHPEPATPPTLPTSKTLSRSPVDHREPLQMRLLQETATAYSVTFTMPNFPTLRDIYLNKITGVVTIRTNNFFFTCE